MKRALEHLEETVSKLGDDMLYQHIAREDVVDARSSYNAFIPIFTFIVTFPFYNLQYLMFSDSEAREAGDQEKEVMDSIGQHALEDATHAKLFLADFKSLDLQRVWGLDSPSKVLWALWISPSLKRARAISSERIREVVNESDPALRFLHVEQLERDGHYLFSASSAASKRLSSALRSLYFGDHHLERETGRVVSDGIEKLTLKEEQLERARMLIDRKNGLSTAMNQEMLKFAIETSALPAPGCLFDREIERSCNKSQLALERFEMGELPAHQFRMIPDPLPEAPAFKRLKDHLERFVGHPFGDPLKKNETIGELSRSLRVASLLFAQRICMLHTFYSDDCQVDGADPVAGAARTISRLFSTEAEGFIADWKKLDMDDWIEKEAPELIDFWFFDDAYGRPELQTMHEIRKELLKCRRDPVMVMWGMLTIHVMARGYFNHIAPIAIKYHALSGIRLPYLEGLHHFFYEEVADDWRHVNGLDALHLALQQPERQDQAIRLLDGIFGWGVRQFDRLHLALSDPGECERLSSLA